MVYTATINWSAINTPIQILQAVNTSASWAWTGINWLVFLVVMITSMNFGFEVSLVLASFIGLLMSLFLIFIGLATFSWTTGVFIAGVILGILFIIGSSNRQ